MEFLVFREDIGWHRIQLLASVMSVFTVSVPDTTPVASARPTFIAMFAAFAIKGGSVDDLKVGTSDHRKVDIADERNENLHALNDVDRHRLRKPSVERLFKSVWHMYSADPPLLRRQLPMRRTARSIKFITAI